MTVTASSSEISYQFDPGRISIQVVSYTGYDTSTPIGATITDVVAGDAGLTITLSASPASDSDVIAGRYRLDNGTANSGATPDATFTEIYDIATGSGYGDMETMARTGSTSTSVIWTDTSDNASASTWLRHSFGMEVKAAAAGGDTLFAGGGIHFI